MSTLQDHVHAGDADFKAQTTVPSLHATGSDDGMADETEVLFTLRAVLSSKVKTVDSKLLLIFLRW